MIADSIISISVNIIIVDMVCTVIIPRAIFYYYARSIASIIVVNIVSGYCDT